MACRCGHKMCILYMKLIVESKKTAPYHNFLSSFRKRELNLKSLATPRWPSRNPRPHHKNPTMGRLRNLYHHHLTSLQPLVTAAVLVHRHLRHRRHPRLVTVPMVAACVLPPWLASVVPPYLAKCLSLLPLVAIPNLSHPDYPIPLTLLVPLCLSSLAHTLSTTIV